MEESFLVYDHSKMRRKSWFVDQSIVSKPASEFATSTLTTTMSLTGVRPNAAGGEAKIPIEEQPLAELKSNAPSFDVQPQPQPQPQYRPQQELEPKIAGIEQWRQQQYPQLGAPRVPTSDNYEH